MGELKTREDVQDLIAGLTLLGTGGGGRPDQGLEALPPHVAAGAKRIPAIAAVVWLSSGIARPAQSPSTRVAPRRTAAPIGVAVLPAPSSKGTIASIRRPV